MGDSELEKKIENIKIEDDLLNRHKKERRELQAKIQALKKTAGKGDKKKKKEVLEEIVQLETDLDKRQADELAALNEIATEPIDEPDKNCNNIEPNELPNEPSTRISKAQKRRDKKAAEDKIRQAEYLAQEELNKTGPRVLELSAIKKLLNQRKLQLHPISSDGDCLYNAIRNQLNVTDRLVCDVITLRNQTADYILENKDTLVFYMTNPTTGDCLNDAEFEKYCETVRNTPAWGGQIEISALSQILKAPIEVIQATGSPTIQGEDQFNGPPLIITYHRHMYSLGEHYNGTQPAKESNVSDDDDQNDD